MKNGIVSAGSMVLAALATLLVAGPATANPYEKYAGSTIVVSWPALSHFRKAETLVQEFTDETGIEVEIDALQYLKLRDRQLLEMSKEEGEYDVVSWVVMWKGEYVSKGLLTPLSQMFTNGALVDPEYDIDDIADAYLQNGGVVGGKKGYMPGKSGGLYGVPFGAETSILAYRMDLLEQAGVAPPTTYDELRAALPVIQSKTGVGALTSRGKTGHQVTAGWLLHLAPLGGKIFDDAWNPVFNNAAGVEAAQIMREITQTGPTGIPSYGFSEASAAFLQGDAAMYIDTLKIAAMSRDPKLSKVDGKVGFALHPVGSAVRLRDGRLRGRDPRQQPEPGGGVPLHPVHHLQGGRPADGGARRRPGADVDHRPLRRPVRGVPGGARAAPLRRPRLAPAHPGVERAQHRRPRAGAHRSDHHRRADPADHGRGGGEGAGDHGARGLLRVGAVPHAVG